MLIGPEKNLETRPYTAVISILFFESIKKTIIDVNIEEKKVEKLKKILSLPKFLTKDVMEMFWNLKSIFLKKNNNVVNRDII